MNAAAPSSADVQRLSSDGRATRGVYPPGSESYDGAEAPFDTTLALLSIALGILVGTGIARNAAAVRRTWREVS